MELYDYLLYCRDWGASCCNKELPHAASIVREALWWCQPPPLLVSFLLLDSTHVSISLDILREVWTFRQSHYSLGCGCYFWPSAFFIISGAMNDACDQHSQSMEMRNVLEMDPYEDQFTRGNDPDVPFPGMNFFLTAWFIWILRTLLLCYVSAIAISYCGCGYSCAEMDWGKPSGLSDNFFVYSCTEEDIPGVPDNWSLVKSPPAQKPKLMKPAARTWR